MSNKIQLNGHSKALIMVSACAGAHTHIRQNLMSEAQEHHKFPAV